MTFVEAEPLYSQSIFDLLVFTRDEKSSNYEVTFESMKSQSCQKQLKIWFGHSVGLRTNSFSERFSS